MSMSDAEATKLFTPTTEVQTFRILQGLCPHNKGWTWDGHGHNDDCYRCKLCRETIWHQTTKYIFLMQSFTSQTHVTLIVTGAIGLTTMHLPEASDGLTIKKCTLNGAI